MELKHKQQNLRQNNEFSSNTLCLLKRKRVVISELPLLWILQPQQNIKWRNVLHFNAAAFITWPAGAIVIILSDLLHSTSNKTSPSSTLFEIDITEFLLPRFHDFITDIQKVLWGNVGKERSVDHTESCHWAYLELSFSLSLHREASQTSESWLCSGFSPSFFYTAEGDFWTETPRNSIWPSLHGFYIPKVIGLDFHTDHAV